MKCTCVISHTNAVIMAGCLYILLLCSYACLAGAAITKGKDFTLAFFPAYRTYLEHRLSRNLYFSSDSLGVCHVTYNDGARKTEQVQINVVNQVIEKRLPDAVQIWSHATVLEPKAIYVNCDVEIELYAFTIPDARQDSESFLVLSHDILSTEYLIPSVDNTAFIGLVATRDKTRVQINIRSTCSYIYMNSTHNSGDSLNVTLNYGEVFRLGSTTDEDSCDLGGSEILSSDPIAVFSGATYYRDNSTNVQYGQLVTQVPPIEAFSRTIIVPSISAPWAKKMAIRIIAKVQAHINITTIFSIFNTVQSYAIEAHKTIDLTFDTYTNVVIVSSAPIMVTQIILAHEEGAGLMFIPGIDQYDNNFVVQSLPLDRTVDKPELAIVSETSATTDLLVNGVYPSNIRWEHLTSSNYSVGFLTVQRMTSYTVNSSSHILVRMFGQVHYEAYAFIAGYMIEDQKNLSVSIDQTNTSVSSAVHLICLPQGWLVTVDLNSLPQRPRDVSQIYLTQHTCTGTLEGDVLVFNNSYSQCHTVSTTSNGTKTHKNTLVYAPLSGVIRNIRWFHDIECSVKTEGTDSVHVYPVYNTSVHSHTTSTINGSQVHITIYKDPAYHQPINGDSIKEKLGQPVYVEVSSQNPNDVMVVHSCDVHVEADMQISHPLIENGCTVDSTTHILLSRDHVTRFKFNMVDLKNADDNGIYVTCHVTFCDPDDYSDRCLQKCHTSPHGSIVGPIVG